MRAYMKVLAFLPLMMAAGAAEAATSVKQVDIASLVPHCDSKVGTLFVSSIACKASGCGGPSAQSDRVAGLMAFANAVNGVPQVDMSHLGDGAGAALVTALKATGCFTVQDRSAIEALKEAAAASGTTFTPAPADWMVTGSITSLAVGAKKSGIGGGFIPVVGSISNTKVTANMSMEVSVVDAHTTEIVDSQSFAATSERSNWGIGGAGLVGTGALFGGASSTNSPELDSVADETVVDAVNAITSALAKDKVTWRPTPVAKN